MFDLLFFAWLAALIRAFFPFGSLFKLALKVSPRRLSLAVVAWLEDLKASLSEKLSGRRGRALGLGAGAVSLAAYLAVVAGAVYYAPKLLVEVTDTEHPVATVSSSSMWPTLKKGDVILIHGVDSPEDLAVGDIVAFHHDLGVTVHRIIEISGQTLTTQGDANPIEDKPVDISQVVGKLVTFKGHIVKIPTFGGIGKIFGPLVSRDAELFDEPDQSEELIAARQATSTPLEAVVPGKSDVVSLDPEGTELEGPSALPSVSADGRFVAFVYQGESQIYVFDRKAGTSQLVSAATSGAPGNGRSEKPAISGDGRFVAFSSEASDLVEGDANGVADVFVRDMETLTTRRISVGLDGAEADGPSEAPAISADGRFVAFASAASNLVASDGNGAQDVFVYDLMAGRTEIASVVDEGFEQLGESYEPSISATGRYVAFTSEARLAPAGVRGLPSIYVRDRYAETTTLASVSRDGKSANEGASDPAISANGRVVAFASKADNLVSRDFNRLTDIFVRELDAGVTERVSIGQDGAQSDANSSGPAISGDGRYVTFVAMDSNLVPGDLNRYRDLFLYDREADVTLLVSANRDGQPAGDHSSPASLNYDGSVIAFPSIAPDIAGGGPRLRQDIFVRVWDPDNPELPEAASAR
jgi:signal peptidase I